MNPERALRNFSDRIEQGDLSGLTLTIYLVESIYFIETASTRHLPFSVEDFFDRKIYERKIVVDGNELEEHIELLRQINADNLIPITHEYPLLVVLYYVFEINGRIIFSVAPQLDGNNSSMIINGVDFKWDDVFFDVIRPFIHEDIVKHWDTSIKTNTDL